MLTCAAPPACSTFIKYVLSCVDTYMEGRWEQKGIYVFYLQLLTDLLHLFVYLVFFTITFAKLRPATPPGEQLCHLCAGRQIEPGRTVLGASLLHPS